MMDLSKTLNSADMITAAQIFGQQARNSVGPVTTASDGTADLMFSVS
jgi:hypothetical protein